MKISSPSSKKLIFNNKKINYSSNNILIGKHYYPYKQIGNLYWTTLNLYEPLGNFGNTLFTDSCWESFEENNYKKGMLYYIGGFTENDQYLKKELENILPNNWRLPTSNDYYDLYTAANGDEKKLTLEEWGGTNELGFNAEMITPMALDHDSPNRYPLGINKVSKYIIVDNNSFNEINLNHPYINERFILFYDNPSWRISIRLVKDI